MLLPYPRRGRHGGQSVSAKEHEYLRVRVRGRYLNDRETLVQAVTKLGAGFWVMTPFETVEGYTVLINRGFAPPGAARRRRPDAEVRSKARPPSPGSCE